MATMMTCGCATAITRAKDGSPYCLTHDCSDVEEDLPDLSGRIARCSNVTGCGATARASKARHRGGEVQYGAVLEGKRVAEAPSSPDLPFFQHRPSQEYDSYYCGCSGWG